MRGKLPIYVAFWVLALGLLLPLPAGHFIHGTAAYASENAFWAWMPGRWVMPGAPVLAGTAWPAMVALCLVQALSATVFSALAAYLMGRVRKKGLPWQVLLTGLLFLLPSVLILAAETPENNGLWRATTMLGVLHSLSYFPGLLHLSRAFQRIPDSVEENALLDGLAPGAILWRLLVPATKTQWVRNVRYHSLVNLMLIGSAALAPFSPFFSHIVVLLAQIAFCALLSYWLLRNA